MWTTAGIEGGVSCSGRLQKASTAGCTVSLSKGERPLPRPQFMIKMRLRAWSHLSEAELSQRRGSHPSPHSPSRRWSSVLRHLVALPHSQWRSNLRVPGLPLYRRLQPFDKSTPCSHPRQPAPAEQNQQEGEWLGRRIDEKKNPTNRTLHASRTSSVVFSKLNDGLEKSQSTSSESPSITVCRYWVDQRCRWSYKTSPN